MGGSSGGFQPVLPLTSSVSSGSHLSEKEVGLQFCKFCSQNERSLKAKIKLEIGLIPHQSPCRESLRGPPATLECLKGL